MNFSKDFKPGTGNTFQEFNIGRIDNFNPNATTVTNNYYGTRDSNKPAPTTVNDQEFQSSKSSKVQGSHNHEPLTLNPEPKEILNYVARLRDQVADKWKSRYMKLWEEILDLKVVAAKVYDPGKQQETNFNRNLVANIIYYLGCYGQLDNGIFRVYNASRFAELLETDKDHSVRAELRRLPPPDICSRIDKLLEDR